MRARAQDRYGSPDVLRITDVPRSVPGSDAVPVRGVAASINARDWHVTRGERRVARLVDRTIFGQRDHESASVEPTSRVPSRSGLQRCPGDAR